MRFCVLFFVVLLAFICLTQAQGSYEDCCLRYVKSVKPSVKARVMGYRRQQQDGGCNIPAVVFVMRHGRQFCTDPREKWVHELIQKIDKMKARRKNYRG